MGASVNIIVRNMMVGNSLFGDSSNGHRIAVINSIVCGLTISAITTSLKSANVRLVKVGGASSVLITALITFTVGALISFIGFECLYLMNKKRQQQIEE